MRLTGKILLILATIVMLAIIYVIAIMDNIYITVTNYSPTVKMQVLIAKPDNFQSSAYIINDSIQSARSTIDQEKYSTRRNADTEYVITVKLDNEKNLYRQKIRLDRFLFISIHISNDTDDSRVVINAFDLREAWNMNLIFGEEG